MPDLILSDTLELVLRTERTRAQGPVPETGNGERHHFQQRFPTPPSVLQFV